MASKTVKGLSQSVSSCLLLNCRGQNVPAASVFLEGGWFPPEQPDLASSIIEVDPQADQASKNEKRV